jgi:chromosome partitioning protein
MIILIGSEKGGTGKTTIATNLAAMRAGEGFDVLLLDTDVQGSATSWCRARDDAGIQPSIFCMQKFGRIDSEVPKLSAKFDDIIIDTGGRDSEELRSGMLVAECFYIPVTPSQFDLWSLSPMVSMVRKAGTLNPDLKAAVVINRASTHPTVAETGETRDIVNELEGIGLSRVILHDRICFRKAVREGICAAEMKQKDPKAVYEITMLYKEIYHG